MKGISAFYVLIFAALVLVAHGKILKDITRVVHIMMACTGKHHSTDETADINGNKKSGPEFTIRNRAKCVSLCMSEQLGLMKDGKFSLDGAYHLAENLYGDDKESTEAIKKTMTICYNTVPKIDDLCEYTHIMAKCWMKENRRY